MMTEAFSRNISIRDFMREETEKQLGQAFRGVVNFESDRSGVTVLLSHV